MASEQRVVVWQLGADAAAGALQQDQAGLSSAGPLVACSRCRCPVAGVVNTLLQALSITYNTRITYHTRINTRIRVETLGS